MPTKVEELIYEVRLLYQTLVQVGESIHQGTGISMGMRAVLEFLDRQGPTTVPDMARARRVSRQRIQALVNSLTELELVTSNSNPASLRSPLIELTLTGKRRIGDMRKLEGEHLQVNLDEAALRQATATLIRLRDAIENR